MSLLRTVRIALVAVLCFAAAVLPVEALLPAVLSRSWYPTLLLIPDDVVRIGGNHLHKTIGRKYYLQRKSRKQRSVIHSSTTTTTNDTASSTTSAFSIDRCDVAVVGGGFGGLYTALALDRLWKEQKIKGNVAQQSLDIALIDPSQEFVFLPLLYDLTMGTASQREVCPSYEELLEGTCIRHVAASWKSIQTIDNNNNDDDNDSITRPRLKLCHDDTTTFLSFDSAVLAVGATPQVILESVEGASQFTQPFYTQKDAMQTRDILFRLDQQQLRKGEYRPKVAIVGGGYGGVELAACLARRLPQAQVSLLTRGPPMKGTRAESLVQQALQRLNVKVELCSVDKIEAVDEVVHGRRYKGQVRIHQSDLGTGNKLETNEEKWDAVFWTAGSVAADPIPNAVHQLVMTNSGRVAVDNTLQCSWDGHYVIQTALPPIFALGDCAEICPTPKPAVPRTAQAAIQQADVVAYNVLRKFLKEEKTKKRKSFYFQDLGTVLSLGGPNGAVLGPDDQSTLGPLLVPLLDTARAGLAVADNVFASILNAPTTNPKSKQVVEKLGLSLGGYGLGVDPDTEVGTLSGTLSGISRRAIYSLRMPTDRQRIYAATSSFVSSVAALAKEAAGQYQNVVEEGQTED